MEWMSLPMARESSTRREGSVEKKPTHSVSGIPSVGLVIRDGDGNTKLPEAREGVSSYAVGDGGASWRRKTQKGGGGSGSTAPLSHLEASRARKKHSSAFGKPREYLEGARSERSVFVQDRKKPNAQGSVSWKPRPPREDTRATTCAASNRDERRVLDATGDKIGESSKSEHDSKHPTNVPLREEVRRGQLLEGGTQNHNAAAMLRAKLLGEASKGSNQSMASEDVYLPMVDAKGRAVRGAFGRPSRAAAEEGNKGKRAQVDKYDERSGQKARYFADDDQSTLNDLVREERFGGQDYDRNFARNLALKGRHRSTPHDVEDEYEHDKGLELYEERGTKRPRSDQQEYQRQRQINDFKRLTAVQERCPFCFDNPKKNRASIMAIGQLTYLKLPESGQLIPGHCQVIPMAHCGSLREVDDAVATEIRNFQKCLIQMFAHEGKHVIFIETALDLERQSRHAVLECIPVGEEVYMDAPLFFKREIEESESEWSQHNAKKLIETKTRGLRGSIPPDFPYFNVEFGLTGGYVHVIDDERRFNRNLGRDVMVSLLCLPQERMHQKPRRETASVLMQQASGFLKKWEPFDWTKQLD
uniref:Cwf19-like C-terminal domain-containing protein n=1 Tax=Picocystis salinarum TaxID=88271 RepID=A0A7S3UCD6_9CHLO